MMLGMYLLVLTRDRRPRRIRARLLGYRVVDQGRWLGRRVFRPQITSRATKRRRREAWQKRLAENPWLKYVL